MVAIWNGGCDGGEKQREKWQTTVGFEQWISWAANEGTISGTGGGDELCHEYSIRRRFGKGRLKPATGDNSGKTNDKPEMGRAGTMGQNGGDGWR